MLVQGISEKFKVCIIRGGGKLSAGLLALLLMKPSAGKGAQ